VTSPRRRRRRGGRDGAGRRAGGHPRQQRRPLRPPVLGRGHDRRLAPDLRGERALRRADDPAAGAAGARTGLGPNDPDRRWPRAATAGRAATYNASLAARHNLAVSLSRELGGSGVTSNVAPRAILETAHRTRTGTRLGRDVGGHRTRGRGRFRAQRHRAARRSHRDRGGPGLPRQPTRRLRRRRDPARRRRHHPLRPLTRATPFEALLPHMA
jgi:NAD(P)-dependent dehydrogenase (short-subunit alcohol dehydrogenase family)